MSRARAPAQVHGDRPLAAVAAVCAIADTPPIATPTQRAMSPNPGRSTLTTSAPWSASMPTAHGPDSAMLRSTIRIPSERSAPRSSLRHATPSSSAVRVSSTILLRAAGREGRSVRDWLNDFFAGRPAWMNALMVFCAYMAFVYVPWDFLIKPAAATKRSGSGSASRLGREAHRAAALGDLRGGLLRLPAHAGVDVAVGRRLHGQVALGMLVWNCSTWAASGVLLGLVSFLAVRGADLRALGGRAAVRRGARRRCASATASGRS